MPYSAGSLGQSPWVYLPPARVQSPVRRQTPETTRLPGVQRPLIAAEVKPKSVKAASGARERVRISKIDIGGRMERSKRENRQSYIRCLSSWQWIGKAHLVGFNRHGRYHSLYCEPWRWTKKNILCIRTCSKICMNIVNSVHQSLEQYATQWFASCDIEL